MQANGLSNSNALLAANMQQEEEEYEMESESTPSKTFSYRPSETTTTSTTRKKGKKKRAISINLSGTKYDIVKEVTLERFGMIQSKDEDLSSFLFWCDTALPAERIAEFKPYQRVNHFPGMGEICRKDSLARNLQKYNAYQGYCRELKKRKKTRTFICKPSNGAMGNGITLTRNSENIPWNENYVVQEYMEKPLLIDGLKFDLRIYVLVTSCDPLRIFLFDDGLVRLSTQPYTVPSDHNIDKLFMHLTNYSINKHSENFDNADEHDRGTKRSIKFFNTWLREHGYSVTQLWNNIADVIIKTIIAAAPHLLHIYRTCRANSLGTSISSCFEILGFDVILDRKLRPWLLEVNRSPSFGTDGKIDYDIKSRLLTDTLRLVNIKLSDRRKGLAAQKAEVRRRLLRPTQRSRKEKTDKEKKKDLIERRIENLVSHYWLILANSLDSKGDMRDRLNQIRIQNAREEYENKNLGGFRRIYPTDDSKVNDKYEAMIDAAHKVILSGSGIASKDNCVALKYLQLMTIFPLLFYYIKEEEILDMLEQCEMEIDLDKKQNPKSPKVLSSMPPSQIERDTNSVANKSITPDSSNLVSKQDKPKLVRTNKKPTVNNPPYLSKTCAIDDDYIKAAIKQREEELTNRTFIALNEMKIKFPGKSDDEAKLILQLLQDNWKFHKPRVASYWLVKLDTVKRKKVVDIVKTNIGSVLQYIWRSQDIENLRLNRIFNRVFNRLLWSHGQGLWNCFSSIGNSWEVIFNKSTESISTVEMNCCRRIVKLCRDCLLIVYQFACEAKIAADTTVQANSSRSTVATYSTWQPSQSLANKQLQYLL
ncbi:uncharacterized protein TRIADDRAFT_59327 [Trichoplax adhaerens]|uniref:Uncharacterized protein n=1 Tax=Trichoplax adhaerens TaxID=10228 RepID=B3S4S4_TRIAD|nr:hypothetical protein TRIADDRAFT_59327 [Trichoplax adhaerens]EDV22263.1 hypothetical protein TRIADDRAFT_59327 [Trichoplax adhaerens]|eukprot:XP_002115418.1 hypothetical protein TRIADDRAFT_59327 [Trichoplax adhaerens]